jgi:ferredoxin
VAYKITALCLKCGTCVTKCPAKAIIPGNKLQVDDLILQPVHIDPQKCTDCGVCLSEEYWCPGQAIIKG